MMSSKGSCLSLAKETLILSRPTLGDIIARVVILYLQVNELPKGMSTAGICHHVRQHAIIAIDTAICPLDIQCMMGGIVCEHVDCGAGLIEIDDVWLGYVCGAHGLLPFRCGIVCRPLRLQGHHTACKDVSVP